MSSYIINRALDPAAMCDSIESYHTRKNAADGASVKIMDACLGQLGTRRVPFGTITQGVVVSLFRMAAQG